MLNLFFTDSLPATEALELTGDEAHHAIFVLRMQVGEELLVSDGAGNWARAKIIEVGKKKLELQILDRGRETESKPRLTVLQALPKSERIKEAIELLVEAGVDEIIPWQAERSIAKAKYDSVEKWQQTAITAAKQSRRFIVPKVLTVTNLANFLAAKKGNQRIIVFHEAASVKLSEIVNAELSGIDEIFIVIGPEGGITDSELKVFDENGGQLVQMGKPIFRSAHAGGAALSAISALIGKW